MANLTAGNTAPPGPYSCASCDSTITLSSASTLPTCENCGGTTWVAGEGPPREPKPVGSI
jgi:Zinc-ribbon containing domain